MNSCMQTAQEEHISACALPITICSCRVAPGSVRESEERDKERSKRIVLPPAMEGHISTESRQQSLRRTKYDMDQDGKCDTKDELDRTLTWEQVRTPRNSTSLEYFHRPHSSLTLLARASRMLRS